jgi:hypothetical protein
VLHKSIKFALILTINVPVVYMVRDVVILRRANPFRGRFEGVGPESRDICGPREIARAVRRVRFGAHRCRDFQGPPLQIAREMDLPASK